LGNVAAPQVKMPTLRKIHARLGLAAGFIYLILGLSLAYNMRGLRFDDPFITYRYAENLASGNGFVFNVGDAKPTLLTTSPLYALLLSLPRLLGADIPSASYWISVAALLAAAFGIYALGRQQQRPFVGFSGGLALLLFPLLWLTMGFETPLFIAVSVWAAWAMSLAHRRTGALLAGVLCGVAMGLRGDGILVLMAIITVMLIRALPQPHSLALPIPPPQTGRQRLGLLLRRAFITERPSILSGSFTHARKSLRQPSTLNYPLSTLCAALAVYAPFALWLTLQFGSPIPTTLATKTAQAVAGLTGFYPFTRYPEGALILIRAYREQSRFFFSVLIGLAIAFGLRTLLRSLLSLFRCNKGQWAAHLAWSLVQFGQTQGGLAVLILWAVLHFIGYSLLGVAPYVWYYAPMIPGITVLVGMLATRQRPQAQLAQMLGAPDQWLRHAVFLLNCVLLLVANLAIIGVLRGGTPPPPSQIAAKILPETKVDIYQRVGEWLRDNTPPNASIGITELGVMSYYAQRHAVDFLGLTHPQYRDSIRHGDFLRGLLAEQPDYVALTNVNSIYTHNPQQEAWFRALYQPVAQFEDARFWGSPMTIWQRTQAPMTTAQTIDNGLHDLGDGWQVTGVRSNSQSVAAGQAMRISVRLRAGTGAAGRELRMQPILMQGGDGLPVVSRLINTQLWRQHDEDWVDFAFVAPAELKKGAYRINLHWVDGGPEVNAGLIKVPLGAAATSPSGLLADLSSGVRVARLAASLTACLGKTIEIPLQWLGGDALGDNLTAFVHVRDGQGKTIAQTDGPPRNGLYPTSVWGHNEVIPDPRSLPLPAALSAGNYAIVVGLYAPQSGARLPVSPSAYRTADGGVQIGELQIKKCD